MSSSHSLALDQRAVFLVNTDKLPARGVVVGIVPVVSGQQRRGNAACEPAQIRPEGIFLPAAREQAHAGHDTVFAQQILHILFVSDAVRVKSRGGNAVKGADLTQRERAVTGPVAAFLPILGRAVGGDAEKLVLRVLQAFGVGLLSVQDSLLPVVAHACPLTAMRPGCNSSPAVSSARRVCPARQFSRLTAR